MIALISPVVSDDLRNPDWATSNHQNKGIEEKQVLKQKEEHEAEIDWALKAEELTSDHSFVLQIIVILTLEHFLNQPHFENKALKKEATSRKPQKFKVWAGSHKHNVLPEEAEMPHQRDR